MALRQLLRRSGGDRSDDPAAVAKLLDRGLKRAMSDSGEPVQFIGVAHTSDTYAAWRSQQLARMPGAYVPLLTPGRWPLVLGTMKPLGVAGFLRNGKASGLYGPPEVGMFAPTVTPELALGAVIGTYLDKNPEPVQIAPPIVAVRSKGRLRA